MTYYICRPDLFRTEITYSCNEKYFSWKDKKENSVNLEYKNIYSIRLLYTPTKINKNQYSIEITDTSGRLTKIKNYCLKQITNRSLTRLNY